MIPLVDDYLQLFLVEKLKFLKEHPAIIDHVFRTGKRSTLDSLKDFIVNKKIKVIIGYPKEQSSLPCYVITLAPESEQPAGIGDNLGWYNQDYYEIGEDELETTEEEEEDIESLVEGELSTHIAGTYMNSTYRIECWSDNGDLTAYMYTILKWAMLTSRSAMFELGWVNVQLSGTDLEPVPDYMPTFVYRRAGQISLMYENLYYNDIAAINTYVEVIENPDDYHVDDDGNIVDDDGGIVIPKKWVWIIRPHFYDATAWSKGDTAADTESGVDDNSTSSTDFGGSSGTFEEE